MQLAHPGLVNSKILAKSIKHVIIYVRNSQECCFYVGKSPCGMQLAGQGLVKLKSGNIQSNSIIFDTNENENYMNMGVRGVWGNYKKLKF